MKRLFANVLFGSGVLLSSMTALHAQYGPYRDYRGDDNYSYRRPYGDSGYGDYRGSFYDRLQSDLARAAQNGYLHGGDLRRFRHASDEIREFHEKWARGRYDRHDLDDAIAATQRVVNIPGLDYRDREAISDDLARMRNFRERMNDRRDYDPGYYRR